MDDGIVLNVAGPSAQPARRVANARGGRWTDRVKAKRVSKRKNADNKPQQRSQSVSFVELDDSSRPAKKARKAAPAQKQDPGSERPAKSTSTRRAPQIVSSLFTYNPEIKVAEAPVAPFKLIRPSNAPLTDKSTFSGLGLDPLIVAHLATKMNISKPTSIQREALPPLLLTSSEDTSDRDVFIQSQTGSGKTLSYLLPILQDLLPLSSLSYIDRSIGTLAVIIAPTRELAKQISDVLEILLSLRLRPKDEAADDAAPSARLTRWLVSGLLIGGENRTHEKSRLRKGLPVLVSTPGRLLDHLQNTSSFNVGKCRWLVLDEADRLMELGFEETIKGILQAMDGRQRLAIQAVEEGKSLEVGGWDWERRRKTILCSATIREDVQHLAGTTLVKPILVKATEADKSSDLAANARDAPNKFDVPLVAGEKFTPPSQLSQRYVVSPLKLRLVALVALLRSLLAQSHGRQGTKIIVFLSCTDSVDYHWRLLGSSSIDESSGPSNEDSNSDNDDDNNDSEDKPEDKSAKGTEEKIALSSPLLPQTSIYRLHGSLPLKTRLASLKGFAGGPAKSKELKTSTSTSSILLCTSVASRGLDLPLVRAVVQYDLPTEGGATEYVHRVGRTARVGKGGEAWSFVAPSEQEWVRWIEEHIQDQGIAEKKASLVPAGVESVLHNGFGGKDSEFEERATQVQLAFERWVLKQKENGELARKAFQSHMRAYATHPSDEKHMFHIRHLHLGHLAKAFALREAPSSITQKGAGTKSAKRRSHTLSNSNSSSNSIFKSKSKIASTGNHERLGAHRAANASAREIVHAGVEHDASAERRMQDVVRRQGRLVKKDGVLVTSGTAEFQIAGGDDLERLVAQR